MALINNNRAKVDKIKLHIIGTLIINIYNSDTQFNIDPPVRYAVTAISSVVFND